MSTSANVFSRMFLVRRSFFLLKVCGIVAYHYLRSISENKKLHHNCDRRDRLNFQINSRYPCCHCTEPPMPVLEPELSLS